MHRDIDLRAIHPDRAFLHVLKIAETSRLASGFLRNFNEVDLTVPANRDSKLGALMETLGLPRSLTAETAEESPRPAITVFRNRDDELQKVKNGLTNASGPHFWLLNAPPELGKTWFPRAARSGSRSGSAGCPGPATGNGRSWFSSGRARSPGSPASHRS